jgi:hypothetical protein
VQTDTARAQPLPSARLDLAAIDHLTIAGWAGRDAASVEAHIQELALLGTPRPSATPVFYRVSSSLLTSAESLEVLGPDTSGEVEYVLVKRDDALWVGLGSDHTDRAAEAIGVALSKQLCGKVVAPVLWRYDDVAPHWDELVVRSWAHRGGERVLYQEGTLAGLLQPDRLIAKYESFVGALRAGAAIFGGTIPTVDKIAPADEFEMELHDATLGRTIRHRYRVVALPVSS